MLPSQTLYAPARFARPKGKKACRHQTCFRPPTYVHTYTYTAVRTCVRTYVQTQPNKSRPPRPRSPVSRPAQLFDRRSSRPHPFLVTPQVDTDVSTYVSTYKPLKPKLAVKFVPLKPKYAFRLVFSSPQHPPPSCSHPSPCGRCGGGGRG